MGASATITTELENLIEHEACRLKATRCTPDAVSWETPPRDDLAWIPDCFLPLWGTPAYNQLSPEQKLRYNHYYALQKTEQFIWLENQLLVAPAQRLLGSADVTEPLRRILQSFIDDEVKHNVTFWRLLRRSHPNLYPGNDHVLFRPSIRFRLYAYSMSHLPRLLSGWTLMGNAFEEHTLILSRQYKEMGDRVDPLFANVYMLHAQDEARHCNLDTVFAHWLIDGQSRWQSRLNGAALGGAFRAYFAEWGHEQPIQRLIEDFPELGDRSSALFSEAARCRSEDYHREVLSANTTPMTFKNRERYEILERAIQSLSSDPRPAGKAVEVKKLLITAIDVTRRGFCAGDDPPLPSPPKGISMRWLSEQEWEANPELLYSPADVVRKRYRDQGTCLIGVETSSGRTVYHLWVTTKGAYVEWIFKYLEAPPGGVLIFDAWVAPDRRGNTLHKIGAAWAARKTLECGRTVAAAGVEEHEFYPFATMYAKMGLGLLVPQHFIIGLSLPRGVRRHWHRPPSAGVLAFTEKLRQKYLQSAPRAASLETGASRPTDEIRSAAGSRP